MARKAIKTDDLEIKKEGREAAKRRKKMYLAKQAAKPLRNKKFEQLTPEDKDELLKVLLLQMNLIKPS
jgi:hypothetical protein